MNGKRQRILVLGGGSGGLVAATHLGRKLGADHDVILIDRRADHVYMPAFLSVMVGDRQPEDIMRNLKRLERRNVRVIQAEVQGIDPPRQQVVLDSGPIGYDYLIVALGLRTAPELIPGFSEGAHHAWEMDAALRLRNALESFQEGRILVGAPPGPYRCPPAPYETQWMLDSYFRQRNLRDRVAIEFFTPSPEPAGRADEPAVWMDAQSKKRGIPQHYSFFIESIDPAKKTVCGRYGFRLSYDLLFLIPPHHPSQALVDSGLAETPAGVCVDYDSLATKWDNVYAIGDCADMPAAKAGVVAHQEAEVVAHNLAVKLRGDGKPIRLRLQTL
ncbi:MAG: NAD(P)/FAD-dependent oxidoreductase [Acidobacteria bacterium]|nr:NAD(P)/FAD-dependent oxidoreductase [Acidobacteriota bacterium]